MFCKKIPPEYYAQVVFNGIIFKGSNAHIRPPRVVQYREATCLNHSMPILRPLASLIVMPIKMTQCQVSKEMKPLPQ